MIQQAPSSSRKRISRFTKELSNTTGAVASLQSLSTDKADATHCSTFERDIHLPHFLTTKWLVLVFCINVIFCSVGLADWSYTGYSEITDYPTTNWPTLSQFDNFIVSITNPGQPAMTVRLGIYDPVHDFVRVYASINALYQLDNSLSEALCDPLFRAIPGFPQTDKTLGAPDCDCAGDPIRLSTGNMYEEVTDYSTAGSNPLRFTRYYNSEAGTNTAAVTLGRNWRSTFDRYLHFVSANGSIIGIIAERENGQQLFFNRNPYGPNWTSDADVDITIAQTASGWMLTNFDDTVETYDAGNGGAALLTSIQERNGYTQSLQYNGCNQLLSVTDSFGRALQFAYRSNETNSLLEGPAQATNVCPGVLQTVTTPDGLVLTYNYNSSGLTYIYNSGGVNLGLLDRLISVTFSTTPQTSKQYLYENGSYPFSLTGMIDEDGNRFATWTYDQNNRANSSQHAGGADLTQVTYNSDGSTSVTNALGQVMVCKFTTILGMPKVVEIDRLASATVPAAMMTYGYDRNGFIATNTDWNTNVTLSTNDVHGQPLILNEAAGTAHARTTTNAYLVNFHLPAQIVAYGKTSNFIYDTNGNMLVLTETDTSTNAVPYSTTGQTRSWTNTFDNLGHLLTTTGPRTDVTVTTSFTFDTSNNVSVIADALGHVTQLTNYTGSGLAQTMIDANGVTNQFAYDIRDRLLSRTVLATSGNATNSFVYDAAGLLTRVTLPDGSFLGYEYDAAQRLQSVTNSLGESIHYMLDANGDITNQASANGNDSIVKMQSAIFDQLGRVLQQVGAYGEATSFGYDAYGNRISISDAKTNMTSRAFDALNRLISVVDPLGNPTGFGYDPQDNLTSVTDPRSLITGYVRDGFGHVIQETSPDKGVTVYILDKAGDRISETDARGVVTLRTFDKLNRVTSENFPASPGENITFTYDATNGGNFGVGHLTGYTDETGSTTLAYNERGDVVSTTRTIGSHAYTTGYTYDLADHITSITYPSGDAVAYTRDTQGRIASVTLHPATGPPAVLATNITYMPFGPLSGLVYGNGLIRFQDYDEDYRLTGITTSGNSGSVQNLALGYDLVNDIFAITNNIASVYNQVFAYDPDYRLTNATGVYGNLGYAYDADGNRLTDTAGSVMQTNNYSPTANMLQSVEQHGITRSFTFTPNGNLASDNRGTSTNLLFGYGNRNRYNTLTIGGNTIASYKYNALGERLLKTVGPTTTDYQYNEQGHLIAESQSNGTVIREYVWLNDMPLAQIESGGIVYYIHPDHLNTPQKLTDAAQNIVWGREQKPFGETQSIIYPALSPPLTSSSVNAKHQFQVTVAGGAAESYTLQASTNLSGSNWVSLVVAEAPFTFTDLQMPNYRARFYRASTTATPVTVNLRFPGQYFDAESGLNYNMMRDYDPTLGRYIQNDPMGLKGGVNSYGYVDGNVIGFVDPLGLLQSDSSGQIRFDPLPGSPTKPFGSSFWKTSVYQLGYVYGDNGEPIFALKNTGPIFLSLRGDESNNNPNYNCIGKVFGNSQVWIDPNQVNKILNADKYTEELTPGIGDAVVYYGQNDSVQHAAVVTSIDSDGNVWVTGKNGEAREATTFVGSTGYGNNWKYWRSSNH